jgi:putative CocE/NonD family hydrolase
VTRYLLIGAILSAALLPPEGRAAGPYRVAARHNAAVKMRDGTILRADVYTPADGRFPVLLQRTPYDKATRAQVSLDLAARGYVVVVQDVRGRHRSDGTWYPFANETQDGYDTVEWAASLPGSDGRVGMFGRSYGGATQLLAAIAQPPHLAGICPMLTASNYQDGWTYSGGAFQQFFNQSWVSSLARDAVSRWLDRRWSEPAGSAALPLSGYPVLELDLPRGEALTRALAPYYLDWLAHPGYDDYWKRWSIEEHYEHIRVPVLTVAAWYDIFQRGSLRNYQNLKSRNPESRHLLIAIGGHAGSGRKIGAVDFGKEAEFRENEITRQWYDYLFHGARNEFSAKPVRIFVMGRNQWREEDEWPVSRARSVRYYLHSGGRSASLKGDGALSRAVPGTESPDHYLYDPANPVPTAGGPLCCDPGKLAPGPQDQRPVELRPDVLVYSTPPFREDMEFTGPVSAELYVGSSAVDTDFTAKLVDVWPDGFAQNLTDGILRMRYRRREPSEWLKPEEVYRITIDLAATSNLFRKGHTLRLEISSSNFPRFDRNLNTEENPGEGRRFVTAKNAVYHDARRPSALQLWVVPSR